MRKDNVELACTLLRSALALLEVEPQEKSSGKNWTKQEDEMIIEGKIPPGRSANAVNTRLSKLKLTLK